MASRMVKLVDNVVTHCIVTSGVVPYSSEGWQDVTGLQYQGQPVSVGWIWDGLFFTPPPLEVPPQPEPTP